MVWIKPTRHPPRNLYFFSCKEVPWEIPPSWRLCCLHLTSNSAALYICWLKNGERFLLSSFLFSHPSFLPATLYLMNSKWVPLFSITMGALTSCERLINLLLFVCFFFCFFITDILLWFSLTDTRSHDLVTILKRKTGTVEKLVLEQDLKVTIRTSIAGGHEKVTWRYCYHPQVKAVIRKAMKEFKSYSSLDRREKGKVILCIRVVKIIWPEKKNADLSLLVH